MARGFESVKEAGRDIEARKNALGDGDFTPRLYFKLEPGASATVRFLEQGDEVNWAWVHEIPVEGKPYGTKVPCRDQDEEGRRIGEQCPGCEQDLKRTFRGAINLIWRGAGEEGEDVVATWISGPRVFVDTLDPLETAYRGLGSRDFVITRKGSGRDTAYSVLPADPDGGAKPLSAVDKKLNKDKQDVSYFVEPPAYEEWGKAKKKTQGETTKTFVEPNDVSPFRPRATA
jgi:hypothetical protein